MNYFRLLDEEDAAIADDVCIFSAGFQIPVFESNPSPYTFVV